MLTSPIDFFRHLAPFGKQDPGNRQGVEMRRGVPIAAIKVGIAIPQIIGYNDNDIGPFVHRALGRFRSGEGQSRPGQCMQEFPAPKSG